MNQQNDGTLSSYLNDFKKRIWSDTLLENYAPQVNMATPLGEAHGPREVGEFLDILGELLWKAEIRVLEVHRTDNHLHFSWFANGPLSEIRDGFCDLSLEDGKIIQQDIQCSINPLVTNQG